MNNTITTKLPGLSTRPTEIQTAYNDFAVAVKNHIQNPNQETLKAMETAQKRVYQIEDAYREGRKLRWLFALRQRETGRAS